MFHRTYFRGFLVCCYIRHPYLNGVENNSVAISLMLSLENAQIDWTKGADAAFVAACCYVGSRERAAILRRACNNICLFRKQVVSVIQVYTYCIKCKTFQFALLPKIYLISEMKAEPDLSLVWDGLVRYK